MYEMNVGSFYNRKFPFWPFSIATVALCPLPKANKCEEERKGNWKGSTNVANIWVLYMN